MAKAPQHKTQEVRQEAQDKNDDAYHPPLRQHETAKKDEPQRGADLAAEPASAVPMKSPGVMLFVQTHQGVDRPVGSSA